MTPAFPGWCAISIAHFRQTRIGRNTYLCGGRCAISSGVLRPRPPRLGSQPPFLPGRCAHADQVKQVTREKLSGIMGID